MSAVNTGSASTECDAIYEEIRDFVGSDRVGFLILVSSSSVIQHLKTKLLHDTTEVKSQISYLTTSSTLQTSITHLASTGVTRLYIVASANIDNARLDIPGTFTTCDFIFCFASRILLDPASTYNGDRLDSHIFSRSPAVRQPRCVGGAEWAFVLADDSYDEPGIAMQALDAAGNAKGGINSAAKRNEKKQSAVVEKCFGVFAGVSTGVGTISALLVSSFEFGLSGAYVTCTNGSFALHLAGRVMQATAAANIGVLGCVGLAAASVVYFVPWKTLGAWLVKECNKVVKFVKDVGITCRDKLLQFLCYVLLSGVDIVTKASETLSNAGLEFGRLVQLFQDAPTNWEGMEAVVCAFLGQYLQGFSSHVRRTVLFLVPIQFRVLRSLFQGGRAPVLS
ncbi:hypothetical protein K440DRAFT_619350 [Wilcoxina mikolae CBS 423.85]|nr:hypothetical protein K440DRAFT_619350 [Wilcoxina mikolae CBS 423.85]